MVADWWSRADGGVLPGEEGGVTVLAVELYDGCRCFGLSECGAFARLDELMVGEVGDKGNECVVRHAGEMVYLVWCVASNLDPERSAELVGWLGSAVPNGYVALQEGEVNAPGCWLYGPGSEVEEMSFAEWAKTMSGGFNEGNPECRCT